MSAAAAPTEARFYTPKTLAERLAVSERFVANLIARREIRSYKLGRTRRIDPADVASYLAANCEERKRP